MTISEKLRVLNTAVKNMITEKRKTEYYEEMLRDMTDGENVGVKIECKGRICTFDRAEGYLLCDLVHKIVKIALENSKADYGKYERELYSAWNETKGEV